MSEKDHLRDVTALEAFTKKASTPKTTFALILVSVAVASLSLSLDEVERYKPGAFIVGVGLAGLFAVIVAKGIEAVKDPLWRTTATVVLPTACGGVIGVVVQAMVLLEVGTSWDMAVKDLGGLVDTVHPVPWLMAGLLLGGLPALVVSGFLLLAGRAVKRLVGHDASEGFGVAFIGASGLISSFGLFIVKGMAVAPLFLVTVASAITVLVAILIDGSRIAFLRRVYAHTGEGFDIVPAEQFAHDPTLAPMVAAAGGGSVLVRLPKAEYRAAAMEPIALLADTEEETLRPLLRRRTAGAVLLVATVAMSALAIAFQS